MFSEDKATCENCAPSGDTNPESREAAGPENPQTEPAVHDPMNPSTFVAPKGLSAPSIVIEFCDRCRWLHRATWTSTELFLTFPPPNLNSITLIPLNADETAGRFRVWLAHGEDMLLVWDRKVEGGFPELKQLKQRIRDVIQPSKSLGHSDR